VNKNILTELMPYNSGETCKNRCLVYVCGPQGFYQTLSGEKKSPQDQGELTGLLKEMNFNEDQVYKF